MSTRKITPLEKTSESFLYNFFIGFLGLITLGFFASYVYKNRNIANLNVMSRLALGSNAPDVKFSANSMYCSLFVFWFPIGLFTFLSGNVPLPFSMPVTLSTNIIMPLLGLCLISGLMLMWYMLKIMSDIKDRLLKIAVIYGRADVIRLYVNDVGRFSSKREKLNQQAYNQLVDNHNAKYRTTFRN